MADTPESQEEKKEWETPDVETTDVAESTEATFSGVGSDSGIYS